jgi:hypothetical protein
MKAKTKTEIIVTLIVVAVLVVGIFLALKLSENESIEVEYVSLGESEITRGHYIYFCTRAYDMAYEKTGISDATLFDTDIDGTDATVWMREQAIGQAKRYLAANKMFDDAGLELSEDDLKAIDDAVMDEWYYNGRLSVYGPMGVDELTYTDMITTEKKIERLAEHYSAELESGLTDEDLSACLTENYASAEYIAINYVNSDNESTLEEYEGYVDEVKNGRPMEELISEIGESGKEYIVTSRDGDSGKDQVVFPKTGSIFPLNFIHELFAADVGDVIAYDDSPNMIYVLAIKTDVLGDGDNLAEYHDEIVDILLSDLFEDRLAGEIETYKFSVNSRNTNNVDIKALYGI